MWALAGIVLEYVSGGDLNAYVNKREVVCELSGEVHQASLFLTHTTVEVEAQNITYQICEALIVSDVTFMKQPLN